MLHEQIPTDAPDLYHYSSSAGLLGIVNYKHAWLSHVAYLNDAREYSYGLDLIHEVMDENYAPLFRVNARDKSFSPIFSMSLTERGDLLSQWRGYCPNGGYSFAFDREQLNDMLSYETPGSPNHPGGRLLRIGRCIYDKDQQVQYIKDRLSPFMPSPKEHLYYLAWGQYLELLNQLRPLDQMRHRAPLTEEEEQKIQQIESEIASLKAEHGYMQDNRTPIRDLANTQDDLRRAIPEIATLLKDPSFEEEKEWRIIYRHPRLPFSSVLWDDNVEFREGKSTLIPYIKIPLATGDD